jgi:hypothetical protein
MISVILREILGGFGSDSLARGEDTTPYVKKPGRRSCMLRYDLVLPIVAHQS